MRKVREAFKTQVEVNGGWSFVFGFYKMAGFRQPFFLQPVPGRHAECFLEVALKPGKASPRELRKFFDGEIEMKIAKHEFFQVNLIRFGKVEQKVPELGHNMQQQLYTLIYF
jgi:hypothetical protein